MPTKSITKATATKKKVVAKPKEINWSKIPNGTKFSAKINEELVYGKIEKENGDIYLCQNQEDGSLANYLHGYKFSWFLDKDVTELKILKSFPKNIKEPKAPKRPLIADCSIVKIKKDGIEVGCHFVTNDQIEAIIKAYKEFHKPKIKKSPSVVLKSKKL